MSRALFITGTDTGVGKTLVARALGAAAHARGWSVAPFKPYESGCARDDAGRLQPADALALRAACGLDAAALPLSACNPYRFAAPLAPALAAAAAGVATDPEVPLAAFHALAARFELLLVEGAGGLLVPLAPGLLVADLAARLGAPLLVVARAALGTINHTLLTVAEARRRGLAVAGVVLSRQSPAPTPDVPHNAATIAALGAVRVFGTLPYVAGADVCPPAALAALAAAHLDLDELFAAAA